MLIERPVVRGRDKYLTNINTYANIKIMNQTDVRYNTHRPTTPRDSEKVTFKTKTFRVGVAALAAVTGGVLWHDALQANHDSLGTKLAQPEATVQHDIAADDIDPSKVFTFPIEQGSILPSTLATKIAKPGDVSEVQDELSAQDGSMLHIGEVATVQDVDLVRPPSSPEG